MGQSSSNPRLKDRRVESPFRSSPPRPQSPTDNTTPPVPHRSLRTKKKSLELPDLASLGLSAVPQSQQGPYSRRGGGGGGGGISSPIPIPIPVPTSPLPNPYASPPRSRAEQLPDALVEQSTHIPIYPERDPRFVRGAPIQSNSTLSFPTLPMKEPAAPAFVPDTVHSTIPIALLKAEQELTRAEFGDIEDEDIGDQAHDLSVQKVKAAEAADEAKEPIPTKILWEGGGRRVVLARAGDNDWKGRHMMEPECAPTPFLSI
jgi:hypothetical protein